MRRTPEHRRRAGFTALEMSIGIVLFLIMSAAVMQTLRSMQRMTLVGDVQAKAQRDAERALEAIIGDLRRSGYAIVGGRAYPHLVQDGDPDADFDVEDGPHHHAPATKTAVEGDPDFGPDVGILFLLPAMWPAEVLAADPEQARRWPYGRPLVATDTGVFGPGLAVDSEDPAFALAEGDGMLVWNVGNPVSYSVRTDARGRNMLVRMDGNGPRVVARDVERLVCERGPDIAPEIPLDAVRVRIFFRVPDDQRQVHRFRVEATVRLRNGTTGN